MIELRKRRIEDSMDQGGDTPALYQVIPEKKTTVGGAMMGSAHIYDVSSVSGGYIILKLFYFSLPLTLIICGFSSRAFELIHVNTEQ